MKNSVPLGTFLVVQWWRLCAPKAGGPGLIPSQETRFPHATTKSLYATIKSLHAETERSHMPQLKIPQVTTKTQCNQINKTLKKRLSTPNTLKVYHTRQCKSRPFQFQFSSVQSLSRVWLFETQWTAACQASLSITNSQSLLKLMSIKSVIPSNHLILCRPLFLLPSIFPSIRVFSNESALRMRWSKYWNFSFSISPSNEYSERISFRRDWCDLLAV